MRKLIILGSTGSIGAQTLDYVRANQDKFQIVGLACNTNISEFKKQILEFNPRIAAVTEEKSAEKLKKWANENQLSISISSGLKGLFLIAGYPADILVNALVGSVGIEPTLFALQAKRPVIMACKEAIVEAGKAIMRASYENNVPIIPIDSEMVGISQCLRARGIDPCNLYKNPSREIEKIILTCSGGPFYQKTKKELEKVTLKEVLAHPTWPNMGKKNLVDSATLANKGLEIIEAMHLFNITPDKIEILIHQQSLVHAIVQFVDGSYTAQISEKDMRIPIAYALNYPHVARAILPKIDFSKLALHFEKPDVDKFQALKLAYQAAEKGGEAPRNFSKSNALAVEKFLNGELKFNEIVNSIAI